MSYTFYKLLHLIGIFLLFSALGGKAVRPEKEGNPWKRTFSIMHGVGVFLLLLAGFGMLARLEITAFPWPGWVWAKVAIWVALGAAPAIVSRVPDKARGWLAGVLALGILAAWLAINKPF